MVVVNRSEDRSGGTKRSEDRSDGTNSSEDFTKIVHLYNISEVFTTVFPIVIFVFFAAEKTEVICQNQRDCSAFTSSLHLFRQHVSSVEIGYKYISR